MKFNFRNNNESTGFIIFSVIITFGMSIFMQDTTILGYGILILLLFVLAGSSDKGSPEKNLEYFMWGDKNIGISIIYGIIGGILTILLGIIILGISSKDMASIIPDFSFASKLLTASVLGSNITIFFNIISQWTTVAPAEEALARVLGPYASISIYKNLFIALALGSLTWITMHIPTFILQGTSNGMYIVLTILSIVTITLLYLTKNIFSSIIAHGTYNTGVLIFSYGISAASISAILIISSILSIIYIRSKA